jgi:hypothetical protein
MRTSSHPRSDQDEEFLLLMVSVVFFTPAIHQKGACTSFRAPRRSIPQARGR